MHILAALTALGDDPCREDADVKKLTGPSGFYRLRIFVVRAGDRRDVHRGI
ncbi:type II toxin-antitoxin system RelE/ParE family toxin [Streptomyces sp. A0592]|nr:type II toxin-antitoxin system RelE/ParE family toxin [Streptomyces sp. A0592]